MVIEPEIIPESSNEGDDAVPTFPDWTLLALIILSLVLAVILLRALVPLILMIIGIIFLVKQYNRLNRKQEE